MLKKLRSIYLYLYSAITQISFKKKEVILCYSHSVDEDKLNEVKRRFAFFTEGYGLSLKTKKRASVPLFYFTPTLLLGFDKAGLIKKIYKGYVYDFDYETNYNEAWEYHELLSFISEKVDVEGYKNKLKSFYKSFENDNYDKSYIFGTGTSLEKAIDRDWSDGYRIVCNTIVKDQELWNHIKPHVITAGDAIYHFGIGNFAVNFRNDLKKRFKETNTIFIYPEPFHSFCLREFSEYRDRLFPIPYKDFTSIHYNIFENYVLPRVGNVLTLLLLPVACTFSKSVYMWGFDGRAPNDKDFWKNSDKQFYQSDVPQLKLLYPGFYNKNIPKNAESNYVKNVHGDSLDNALNDAEQDGFKFVMMHKTYTEVLAKRLPKDIFL